MTTEATLETKRGMKLPCPKCGEQEAMIQLDLDDGQTCSCRECDDEFSLDDVREFIGRWAKMIAWIETMPAE